MKHMVSISEKEREVTKPIIEEASILKQVVKNRDSPLDVLREVLSNSCAQEVDASEVIIIYHPHPQYGTTFTIEDDGCGMGYSGDPEKPRRLDKFKNLGYSKVAGIDTDEFGYKGLGSKLLLDCKQLKVETWTGNPDEPVYELRAEDPRSKLIEAEEPKIPSFDLYKSEPSPGKSSFTRVTAKGYAGGDRKYDRKDLERYLYYHTIVGCTEENRANRLPDIFLNVEGDTEKLDTGFPWIKEEDDWRTVTIDPPISKTVQSSESGIEVTATLKGGFTLNTGRQKFGLSSKRGNIGIFASINGIPYFRLPYDYDFIGDKFKKIYKRFTCFVVECDELHETLTMNRGSFDSDNEISLAFMKACRQCFTEFSTRNEYRRWHRERRKSRQIELAELLEERKKDLRNSQTEYVYLKADALSEEPEWASEESSRLLHRVPKGGENDTLAILWKLEAHEALPFEDFTTLEHTNQQGIDVIVNFKEDKRSQSRRFVPCEVETKFENFERHAHYPGQTSLIICWEIEHPNADVLDKTEKEYKYFARLEDQRIPVYELKNIPAIEIRQLDR